MADYGERHESKREPVVFAPARTLKTTKAASGSSAGEEADGPRISPFEPLQRLVELLPSAHALPPLSPTTLGVNQNNYNPAGFDRAALVRLSASGAVSISGFQANGTVQVKLVGNVGAANNITLVHENAGSSAANRFNLKGAANFTMTPGTLIWLAYDTVSSRWRLVGA